MPANCTASFIVYLKATSLRKAIPLTFRFVSTILPLVIVRLFCVNQHYYPYPALSCFSPIAILLRILSISLVSFLVAITVTIYLHNVHWRNGNTPLTVFAPFALLLCSVES